MSILNPIPRDPITQNDKATPTFRTYLAKLYLAAFSVTESGTTTDRPTTNLWVGRTYFDTTLGQPIWVQSISPTVWVDATGATA